MYTTVPENVESAMPGIAMRNWFVRLMGASGEAMRLVYQKGPIIAPSIWRKRRGAQGFLWRLKHPSYRGVPAWH